MKGPAEHVVAALASVALAVACQPERASQTQPSARASALPSSSAAVVAASAGSAPPGAASDTPRALEAAPRGVTVAEREARALELFAPGRGEALPVVATEPGQELDRNAEQHFDRAVVPLSAGAVRVEGGLLPDVVRRVVRQRFGGLRACYDEAVRRAPELHGQVTLRLTVGVDGAVSAVDARSGSIADAGFLGCLETSLAAVVFPTPEGGAGAVVEVNLDFSGGG